MIGIEGNSEEVAARILRSAGAPLRMTLAIFEGDVENVAAKTLRYAQDDTVYSG